MKLRHVKRRTVAMLQSTVVYTVRFEGPAGEALRQGHVRNPSLIANLLRQAAKESHANRLL